MSDIEKLASTLMTSLMAINDTLAEIRNELGKIKDELSVISVSMPT